MTEHESVADEEDVERVRSLVPNLDAILCGGFLRGGLYMIQGLPGAGKTVLASQILYRLAAKGSRTLFVTVLGENHGRMMLHLRQMRFFDESLIPENVAYISAYAALEEEGLKGLVTLIRQEVLAHRATLLVLDGMMAIDTKIESVFEMKRFTHELQTLASATDCTMFLLTTSNAMSAPEHTMVDGLIELRQQLYGMRSEGRLVIHKLRGSNYLEGQHSYRITGDGLTVFPRIEALYVMPTRRDAPPQTHVLSGVAAFDAMLGGGIPAATMMALVGPSGAGKTTFGLHFLSQSNAVEPGLLFGCSESPERLRLRAKTMGVDLAAAEQRGDLEILWYPVGEHILDELAHRLLDAVRLRNVKRLFIDGLSAFQKATLDPDRLVRFWSALTNELRSLGVTTVHTSEMPELMGTDIRSPVGGGIAWLAEVMVVLRYVEIHSRLYRLISLFKVREGAFDPSIREFMITDAGIVVGKPFEGVEAILGGTAREAARTIAATTSEDSNQVSPSGDAVPPR